MSSRRISVRFAALRAESANEPVSPFFDPSIKELANGKAFWTACYDVDGQNRPVTLQAFRIDLVDTCLADWALGFVIGIYMKRGEVIVPSKVQAAEELDHERIQGKLVYHGEFWVSKDVRQKQAVETIPLWGMVLALMKWNPDAIWGIVEDPMATEALSPASAMHISERGFFEWEWLPSGADAREWLAITERARPRISIEERAATLA